MKPAAILMSVLLSTVASAEPVRVTEEHRPTGGQVGDDTPAFAVREGYRVEAVSGRLDRGTRFLEVAPDGTLFVSFPGQGKIDAFRDADHDGKFESRSTFVDGHPDVHSMCFSDGWLYYTQSRTGEGHKSRYDGHDGKAQETVTLFKPGTLPAGGGHPFRGIVTDGKRIFITVSDPQNMTGELDTDRKQILSFDMNGGDKKTFATGLRNTEKLRFAPGTEMLYGMDHGSDNFGGKFGESKGNQPITDVLPPEELNLYVDGGFYGHPYISGNRIVRPEFADRKDILELAGKTIPPAMSFGAHWAGNGFTFLSKDTWEKSRGDMFVAFHGSWNSTVKVGYKVVRVLFDNQTHKPMGYQTIVSTLGENGDVLARPVDCVEMPDGSVIWSCDQTNRLYRISPVK